ncbi:MAG: SDR family NAD(P)-dependent oxidoreductase [Gammaproteobacteria bacterium]|nr:SDR family NAD(P)-dependent oxidoreductase [Gammaproteobacteria bacterium]
METQAVAVVVGVGAERGLGAVLCRRFAAGGHHVIAMGRTAARLKHVVAGIHDEGGSAEAWVGDATREEDVAALFAHAMAPGAHRAPADLVVFNAGNNQRIDFTALTPEQFENFWRVGCLAGFLVGREVARHIAPLGRGTLIFTGASASLRGRPGFAHFAAAKAGLRMLAQSMAREFGPQGLHVAHVVVDGGIDGQRLRERVPEMLERLGTEGLLQLEPIAEAFWQLYRQHPSAWTHEIDLRPFKESF